MSSKTTQVKLNIFLRVSIDFFRNQKLFQIASSFATLAFLGRELSSKLMGNQSEGIRSEQIGIQFTLSLGRFLLNRNLQPTTFTLLFIQTLETCILRRFLDRKQSSGSKTTQENWTFSQKNNFSKISRWSKSGEGCIKCSKCKRWGQTECSGISKRAKYTAKKVCWYFSKMELFFPPNVTEDSDVCYWNFRWMLLKMQILVIENQIIFIIYISKCSILLFNIVTIGKNRKSFCQIMASICFFGPITGIIRRNSLLKTSSVCKCVKIKHALFTKIKLSTSVKII